MGIQNAEDGKRRGGNGGLAISSSIAITIDDGSTSSMIAML